MFISSSWGENFPFVYRIPTYKIFSDIVALEVGFNRIPPNLFQTFNRDVYILHYILKGKGYFMNQPFDDTNGYFVSSNEPEITKGNELESYESYWIMFKGEGASSLLKKLNLMHNCIFSIKNKTECINAIKEVLYKQDYSNEAEEAYALQSALYKIISLHINELNVSNDNMSFTANIIATMIKKNYTMPIKISKLAHELNITRNYLFMLFKKEYGVSPQEYLISYRIKKAKQFLEDTTTNLSIKEISTMVGIENPLYFSRLFSARVGMTPSEYKNQLRNH